jgi:cation diffusion facilitator family transporter
MLSKLILKNFVKNYEDVTNEDVRQAYGYLGGIVGILINFILFVIEISVGVTLNSIAIIADSFHNLTDVAASIITIISFKIAKKPADKEHPFGHGRIEYIGAMVVSFLIILVGIEFIKSSFERILHPAYVKFELVSFIIVLITIPLKIWLSKFNKRLGKLIDSSALEASGADALNDVFILFGVIISLLITKFIGINVDGYIGIIVAGIIIFSGISLIKETLDPLLGEAPDPKLVRRIIKEVLNYDYITGVHDLIVHNYGPGRCMASLHAEVPCNISVVKIHEIIDTAEREISKKFNMFIVIHMDPVNTDNSEVLSTKKEVVNIIKKYSFIKSIHDFRIVGEGDHKNIIFDVVVNAEYASDDNFSDKLNSNLNKDIKRTHPFYNVIITVDKDFTSF